MAVETTRSTSHLATATLVSFALQLEPTSTLDAATLAVERGWIDEDGKPTCEGRRLVRDLQDQSGTPSVFRNVA